MVGRQLASWSSALKEFLHGDRDVTVWAGMTALQRGLAAFALASAGLYLRADRQPGSRVSHETNARQ